MERVAFLIEETNERLGCLLNPETLVMRRVAGVQPRRSATGQLTGTNLGDDPLLYTGGGKTELDLDLLFDVSLAGSSITTEDVRDLTGPLWNLAENSGREGEYGKPRVVRFVWGKAWNIPGVVVAIAERLEYFTASGAPRRAWLRMRLRRVAESVAAEPMRGVLSGEFPSAEELLPLGEEISGLGALEGTGVASEQVQVHQYVGGTPEGEVGAGERLDEIAYRYLGDAGLWRLIALFNDIADPLHLAAGALLRIPSIKDVSQSTGDGAL